MALPSVNYAQRGQDSAGNALFSGPLAAGASQTVVIDFNAMGAGGALGGDVGVTGSGGTSVSATSGLQVQIFPQMDLSGSTPNFDTIANVNYTIPMVVSSINQKTFRVSTGKVQVKITNLDATNSLSNVAISGSKLA